MVLAVVAQEAISAARTVPGGANDLVRGLPQCSPRLVSFRPVLASFTLADDRDDVRAAFADAHQVQVDGDPVRLVAGEVAPVDHG
jgi:hypothetical protein